MYGSHRDNIEWEETVWVRRTDESGRSHFYHVETKQIQWTAPDEDWMDEIPPSLSNPGSDAGSDAGSDVYMSDGLVGAPGGMWHVQVNPDETATGGADAMDVGVEAENADEARREAEDASGGCSRSAATGGTCPGMKAGVCTCPGRKAGVCIVLCNIERRSCL